VENPDPEYITIPIETITTGFDEFWAAYPASDAWGNFIETRKIRSSKPRARTVYSGLLKSGVLPETLLTALKREVEFRKKTSIGKNNLTYMQSPAVWLHQHSYEEWLKDTPDEQINTYGKDLV